MAHDLEAAAWESTATLAFHLSRMGSGIGYWKRGTLGGRVIGGDNASVGKIGRCKVPMTPWWSKKAGLDRKYVLRLERNVLEVPCSEVVNT